MPIQQLDYPAQKILMDVGNQVEASYRITASQKEPWTIAFIEACPPSATFLDVGANVGPYTLVAIAHGLHVVAVEPSYENYAKLCRNLALNNWLDRVLVLPFALGERPGVQWFQYQDLRPGAANHILGGTRKEFFHRQQVLVFTLDDLRVYLRPDQPVYVKLDIDGGEMDALTGGKALLASGLVQGLMIEMPLPVEKEIVAYLNSLGWRMAARYDHRGEVLIDEICYGHFVRA